MTITQQAIVTLLKSAVTRQVLPLPEGFVLESVYNLVKAHHMAPMIYDGAVRCGISKQEPVMQKLFQEYLRALMVSEKQMQQLSRVFSAFEEAGIEYLPLKGCTMKALYPAPELRVMGDADVLIRLEQYEKIVPIMQALGFTNKADTDHELVWTGDGLYLELHKRLIPSYNADFHDYYGNSWRFAREKNGCCWQMSPEDTFLFQFTHFAKHYRDGGIGCRHVVDLWVYLRANPQMDFDYLEGELEKLQLLTFYRNIRRLICAWFEEGQTDKMVDFITDFIFDSGSWGRAENRAASVGVRDSGQENNSAKSRFKYLLGVTFPNIRKVRYEFPILQKAPWLLPVIWVIRPFHKILFDKGSMKRYRRALRQRRPEQIKTRRQMLRYVGLDYHF